MSIKENVDTTTPTGKLVFTIFAAIAEFERSLIIERVRAGQEAARRRGRVPGRPKRAVDIDQATALLASGMGVKTAARRMGISPRTLGRALDRAGRKPGTQAGREVAETLCTTAQADEGGEK